MLAERGTGLRRVCGADLLCVRVGTSAELGLPSGISEISGMHVENCTAMKLTLYMVTACFALAVIATTTPCPPGTVYYGPGGLCYWEDQSQMPFENSSALCRAAHSGGELALLPFPHSETFLVDTFGLLRYDPVNGSNCQCTTWWTGYRVYTNASVASSTFGEPGTPWMPKLDATSFVVGDCVRVLPNVTSPPSFFRWYVGPCNIQRRALCSIWAGQRSTTWSAEAGRVTNHVTSSRTAASRLHCAVLCRLQDGCASFNFHPATGTCELCSKVKSHPDVTTTSDPGFQHFEVIG